MKSKASKLSKWQVFDKKQVEKEGEKSTKRTQGIFDASVYTVTTHAAAECGVDVVVPPELMGAYGANTYVEVCVGECKFVVQVTEESLECGKARASVSVLRSLTDLLRIEYDLGYKFAATFRAVDPKQENTYNLEMVELTVKEHYVSRRDQMKINARLKNSTVYVTKACLFGPMKVTVSNALMRSKEYACTGIVGSFTRLVYRSQEAKVTLLLEVSADLLECDGAGQVALESLQKFLKVFQMRNAYFQCNHRLEVLLYARLHYPQFATLADFY